MMGRTAILLLAGLTLAACKQEAAPSKDNVPAANAPEQAVDQCAPPALAMADNAQLESKLLDEAKANFAKAYKGACSKGLLKDKPLIDPKASDQGKLFLINAPEDNVASIYLSEVDGNKMVLEYPFLTTDGKTQVPSVDELGEAIYCAVHGASQQEQESSGRCLVD
jgi:hypothetical protein